MTARALPETMPELTPEELAALSLLGRGRSLSHRDIAEILGISHGSVVNIEQRALACLRKLSADWKGLTTEVFGVDTRKGKSLDVRVGRSLFR